MRDNRFRQLDLPIYILLWFHNSMSNWILTRLYPLPLLVQNLSSSNMSLILPFLLQFTQKTDKYQLSNNLGISITWSGQVTQLTRAKSFHNKIRIQTMTFNNTKSGLHNQSHIQVDYYYYFSFNTRRKWILTVIMLKLFSSSVLCGSLCIGQQNLRPFHLYMGRKCVSFFFRLIRDCFID